MTRERAFWLLWLGGLVLFAMLRIPHGPLAIAEVPGGILDHQAAATAAEVDRIQRAWTAAGLYENARWGMLSDLVFIGVYGVGALLGGLVLRDEPRPLLHGIGQTVALAALVFLATDYAETLAQLAQLLARSGQDALASTAAFAQPIKMVAWVVTFLGIAIGFAIRRFSRRAA